MTTHVSVRLAPLGQFLQSKQPLLPPHTPHLSCFFAPPQTPVQSASQCLAGAPHTPHLSVRLLPYAFPAQSTHRLLPLQTPQLSRVALPSTLPAQSSFPRGSFVGDAVGLHVGFAARAQAFQLAQLCRATVRR